jgi:hypothetical protein
LYEYRPGTWVLDNNCRADYSNYGDWVSLSAPGTMIQSTLPWDKPFYLNYYAGYSTRYDSLSGTSMATPFVAAAAARRWGYKPLETNAQIGADVTSISSRQTWDYEGDGSCWPSSMDGKVSVDVAALLDRGALIAGAYDAGTGLPLNGATIGAYQGGVLKGSAVITPQTFTYTSPYSGNPSTVYTYFNSYTEVINLPAGSNYVAKVQKAGYAPIPQAAFQQGWFDTVYPGSFMWVGEAGVPPASTNFETVLGWEAWWRSDYNVSMPDYDQPWDLDLNVWLPDTPNPLDASQPAPFIVGMEGDAFGYLEGDPTGSTWAFPFAQLQREGGWTDYTWIETIRINSRAAHGTLAANPALPYYPGDYTVAVTDWGQTIDHDGDGCGDNYGYGYDPAYDPSLDADCPPTNPSGTLGIPLMGVYFMPYVYVWKDGAIKVFVNSTASNGGMPWNAGDTCNAPWWSAVEISSGATGTATYTIIDQCGDYTITPYNALGPNGRMYINRK